MTRTQVDVLIVGAGFAGLYGLHKLRGMGLTVQVVEAASGVGGTWFWNRYPGARFDSESVTYGYSFSEELLSEWDWKERFSGQPENLRYLNYVADKFDLRPHMQFGVTVERAVWSEAESMWHVHLDDGVVIVESGGTTKRFDLRNEQVKIDVRGRPGDGDWRVRFYRRALDPVEVDADSVDPTEFMTQLRAYRPGL